jgi:hypothetical protein
MTEQEIRKYDTLHESFINCSNLNGFPQEFKQTRFDELILELKLYPFQKEIGMFCFSTPETCKNDYGLLLIGNSGSGKTGVASVIYNERSILKATSMKNDRIPINNETLHNNMIMLPRRFSSKDILNCQNLSVGIATREMYVLDDFDIALQTNPLLAFNFLDELYDYLSSDPKNKYKTKILITSTEDIENIGNQRIISRIKNMCTRKILLPEINHRKALI